MFKTAPYFPGVSEDPEHSDFTVFTHPTFPVIIAVLKNCEHRVSKWWADFDCSTVKSSWPRPWSGFYWTSCCSCTTRTVPQTPQRTVTTITKLKRRNQTPCCRGFFQKVSTEGCFMWYVVTVSAYLLVFFFFLFGTSLVNLLCDLFVHWKLYSLLVKFCKLCSRLIVVLRYLEYNILMSKRNASQKQTLPPLELANDCNSHTCGGSVKQYVQIYRHMYIQGCM